MLRKRTITNARLNRPMDSGPCHIVPHSETSLHNWRVGME